MQKKSKGWLMNTEKRSMYVIKRLKAIDRKEQLDEFSIAVYRSNSGADDVMANASGCKAWRTVAQSGNLFRRSGPVSESLPVRV